MAEVAGWNRDHESRVSKGREEELVCFVFFVSLRVFVLKPKHSAFFETTLDTLLAYLRARTLILTGVAGNICLLFSANDASMRDYHLVVPSDCVASNTPDENHHAPQQIAHVLKGDITPSGELDRDALVREAAAASR